VLSGYSAAALLDADCAPHPDVPAEVTVVGGGQRAHCGLAVRRDRLALGETTRVGDVGCTSPLRTAYDLGRQEDLVEAVVAVDRLANRHRFPPDLLLHIGAHYRGGPGTARLCRTLAHVNPSAGSPMESRRRMIIVRGGLPKPQVQWVVQDVEARTAVWLDLAWPDHRIGVEFEGGVTPRPWRCSATPGATHGWSTAAGGSTGTRSTTCTAIPDVSSPSWPAPCSAPDVRRSGPAHA
jgi:hypothetical protein